jgi:type I protein arginine methyltransferase
MAYALRDYARMLDDEARLDAYEGALRAAIGRDTHVLDLGAGSGICTLMALRLGARHVTAIEVTSSASVIRAVVQENGFDPARVTVVRGDSRQYQPKTPIDVIVSDLRGVSPLFGAHLHVLRDASTRLLKPGGVLLPEKDVLYFAPVEAPHTRADALLGYASGARGFAFKSAQNELFSTFQSDSEAAIEPAHLLATGRVWDEVHYGPETKSNFGGSATFTALRSGTCDGLALWFEAHIFQEFTVSSAPGRRCVYNRAYLPFASPFRFEAGASYTMHVHATEAKDGFVWAWGHDGHRGSEGAVAPERLTDLVL